MDEGQKNSYADVNIRRAEHPWRRDERDVVEERVELYDEPSGRARYSKKLIDSRELGHLRSRVVSRREEKEDGRAVG